MAAPLADRLRAQIRDQGPIPVSTFVEAALYDEHEGFYVVGGRAGRRGDFLTAPEVGPLFGAVISRAVDSWWESAGRPARFTVVEHGAGPGTLARTVMAAEGGCFAAGALRWVMIEPSASQREAHPGGAFLSSFADASEVEGLVDVVFANELLDNLPFDIVARRGDRGVALAIDIDDGRFVLVDGPPVAPPPIANGARLPRVDNAAAWVVAQRARHPSARLVVLDYMATAEELVTRDGGWLRAYRDHDRIDDWLADPGLVDITVDLPLDELLALHPTSVRLQADFLRAHGIDQLVDQGRAAWHAGAAVGDLAALKGRSRLREAEALLDAAGFGGFHVLEWEPEAHRSGC